MNCDCNDAPSFDAVIKFLREREAYHLERVAKLSKLPNVEKQLAYENGKADAYKEAFNTLVRVHNRMNVVAMPSRLGFKARSAAVFAQIVEQLKSVLPRFTQYIKVGG